MKKAISTLLSMMLLAGTSVAEQKPVQAVIRGNTAVVAVPYEWLYERCSKEYPEMPSGERNTSFQSYLEIADENWLDNNLPPGVVEGLELANGYEGEAYHLDLDMEVYSNSEYADSDRLEMSTRYIDDTWYLVFSQKEMNVDDSCRYSVRQVYWEEKIEVVHHWGDLIPEEEMDVRRFKGDAAYEVQCGSLDISIFETIGANIAVIEEKNADKNLISQVQLETPEGSITEISGYMDGKNAVYCCVFSDSEVKRLLDGEAAHLRRNHLKVDYAGTQWGVVRSGKYWGIVDESGSFIVDAKYTAVERTEVDGAFILQAPNLSFVVYDANRRRSVLTMLHDGGFGTGIKICEDGTIIAAETGKIRIYSLDDGGLLQEIDSDSDPDEYMLWLKRYTE